MEWCTYPQVGERLLQQGCDAVQARGGPAALGGGLGPELLKASLLKSEGQGLPALLQLTLLVRWGLQRVMDIKINRGEEGGCWTRYFTKSAQKQK